MTLTPRIFRLFVSSTFSDFIAEREALQEQVFPKLVTYCAKRGARFQAVDLRWGITEEAQREHDTMRICLEEVRRCQQLSPRPNFAVLLGDRYGWEPVPARIPQDHWRRLMKAAAPADRALIKDSYRLDENAIPPVYFLPKRASDQAAAFQHEANLLQALRRAARRGFRGNARLPYFASATHQEIALGALSARDEKRKPLHPEQHVHVYVRHLSGLPQDESAKDFIDWDASAGQVTPGARDRLHGLEQTLRERLPGHVHDLHTAWSRHGRGGAVNKAYIKRFCKAFLSHQKALIDAELASLQQTDERQQREQAHQDFGAERARVFAGRQALLARIARYTEFGPKGRATRPAKKKPPAAPLILLGGGGSGKSALLARAAKEAARQAKRSGAIVLQRYIGGVPGTESLMSTLTLLTADIASLYGQPKPPVPESAKALAEAFLAALGHASARRPLCLYLDALDQLDNADSAWMLEWLPKELPEHVRVVASARIGTQIEQAARRRYPKGVIEVPPMKPAEGRAMLKAWLKDKRSAWFNAGIAPTQGRRLTAQQQAAVLGAFEQNGSALWLKLAYEEAASWKSSEAPRNLPTDTQDLIKDLIDHRLLSQENHPKVFTERALAYLTAGRFGLSEDELGRALGTDKDVRAEFVALEKTQRTWDDPNQLPPILWSRLFFDLQPYLGFAQMDGTRLMRWFHREFAEVMKARFLESAEQRRAIHGALADTFHALERELRPNETNDDALFRATDASGTQVSAALRRVMEQPWQLAQAERREELLRLLTDFGFCMGRYAANGRALEAALHDYRQQRRLHRDKGVQSGDPLGAWADGISGAAHLLLRAEAGWPAHRILLQVAVEHADDSALTLAAQEWLERGLCDWVWARRVNRPKRYQPSPLLTVMEGHTGVVWDAQILPDGRVLSWSEDHTLRLWDGHSGAPLAVLEGHTRGVRGAQVLPDGRVLSWSWDHTLRLWDGHSGAPLALLEGHTGVVWDAQIRPDGRVLSWSEDHTLRLWDGHSGAPLAVLEGHTGGVDGAQVLPDGRVLSWSGDHTLRLWDGHSGAPLAVMEGHTDGVLGAQVLPDGRVLSWSEDETLRLWDGYSGAPLAVMEGHTSWVNGAQVLPDGRLLSWSGDHTLRLWDGHSGAPLAVMEGHTDWVNGAQVLPDGRVLSWSYDHTLRLWDGHSGVPLAGMEGHTDKVVGARILPDGQVLSWSWDETLRLWEGQSGAPLAVLEAHADWVLGAQVLPYGRVLSWSKDGTLRLWDGHSGAPRAVLGGHTGSVLGAQVLPYGRVLSWSRDRTLRLWDGHSGAPLAVLGGHTRAVDGAEALPDGRVLSWSEDDTLRLWDGYSGAPLAVLEGQTWPFGGAQILPEGRVLSWGGNDTLRLWEGHSGALMAVLEGHTSKVDGAQVLPDGRVLSWSWDDTLRLWDGHSGAPLAVMEGHTGWVRGARVLPDGRVLSWSIDGTLRLWDGHSGAPLAVLEGHTVEVNGAQVLPDGRVLSWSDDHTLRLWDGHSGAPLAVLEGHTDSVYGAQVLPDGRVLSRSLDGTLRLWDGHSGAPLEVISQPWVWSARLPVDWAPSDGSGSKPGVAGAKRLGALWAQDGDKVVAFAHPTAQWRALWHGDDLSLQDTTAAVAVCTSGRQMIFLQLMQGSTPLPIPPPI